MFLSHATIFGYFNWILVITFNCLLSQASGIKCFQCDSKLDPKCANINRESVDFLVNCGLSPSPYFTFFANETEQNVASKMKATKCRKVSEFIDKKWTTFRSCEYLDLSEGAKNDGKASNCIEEEKPGGIRVEYCTCGEHDGCNYGGKTEEMNSAGSFLKFQLLSLISWILIFSYLLKLFNY